jgi:hypothetical protein
MKLKIETPKELLDSLDPLKARLSALTLMAVAGLAMAFAALLMAMGARANGNH